MKMKPVVLSFAAALLLLHPVLSRYERADAALRAFYSQILSGNFGDARNNMDEAIALWPTNSRYYGWRAYCQSQKLPSQCSRNTYFSKSLSADDRKTAEAAIADYRRALQLNNRDAVVHHNLAWLEHLLGDDHSAEQDWREAIAIDPDNSIFHLSYGMYLEEAGDAPAAREQFGAAIQKSPAVLDSPFFVRYRNRSPDAAAAMVTAAITKLEQIRQQGNNPILEATLGKLYAYSGNFTRAVPVVGRSVSKASQSAANVVQSGPAS